MFSYHIHSPADTFTLIHVFGRDDIIKLIAYTDEFDVRVKTGTEMFLPDKARFKFSFTYSRAEKWLTENCLMAFKCIECIKT